MKDLHLIPVRARLIKSKQGQGMLGFPWSSLASGDARAPKRLVKGWEVAASLKAKGLSAPSPSWIGQVISASI